MFTFLSTVIENKIQNIQCKSEKRGGNATNHFLFYKLSIENISHQYTTESPERKYLFFQNKHLNSF